MKIKQTLYMNKCDELGTRLSLCDMSEFSGWVFLGMIDVEFEAPDVSADDLLRSKIESAYKRAAEIQTVADVKVNQVLEEARNYQSQLKKYNTESTTGADEKALIAGGCEVIKTEYLA